MTVSNKIGQTMETIEGIAKAAGSAAKQGVQDVTRDASQAISGNYDTGANENIVQGVQQLPAQQKKQIKANDSQNAAIIRQNIANIDAQMAEIRKKRNQQEQQAKQTETNKTNEKKFEEKKKDSVLSKLIKSRKGTKEGTQRASG